MHFYRQLNQPSLPNAHDAFVTFAGGVCAASQSMRSTYTEATDAGDAPYLSIGDSIPIEW